MLKVKKGLYTISFNYMALLKKAKLGIENISVIFRDWGRMKELGE